MMNRLSAAIAAGLLMLATAGTLEAQQPAPVRVSRQVLDRYVGEWVYPNGETVMVRRYGDVLFREVPGQRVPLVPLSETRFRLGYVFTAEFVIDKTGGITQILSDGTGAEYRLRRKGSRPALLPDPAGVRVPRSVLERYVGVYEFIPGQMRRTDLRVVIGLRGDTLTRSSGQGDDPLIPISETRFIVAGTSLPLEFVIDDAGVTVVLGSGGQQMLARMTQKR